MKKTYKSTFSSITASVSVNLDTQMEKEGFNKTFNSVFTQKAEAISTGSFSKPALKVDSPIKEDKLSKTQNNGFYKASTDTAFFVEKEVKQPI